MPRHRLQWKLIVEGTPPTLSWDDPSMQLTLLETLLQKKTITKEQFDKLVIALNLADYYGTLN